MSKSQKRQKKKKLDSNALFSPVKLKKDYGTTELSPTLEFEQDEGILNKISHQSNNQDSQKYLQAQQDQRTQNSNKNYSHKKGQSNFLATQQMTNSPLILTKTDQIDQQDDYSGMVRNYQDYGDYSRRLLGHAATEDQTTLLPQLNSTQKHITGFQESTNATNSITPFGQRRDTEPKSARITSLNSKGNKVDQFFGTYRNSVSGMHQKNRLELEIVPLQTFAKGAYQKLEMLTNKSELSRQRNLNNSSQLKLKQQTQSTALDQQNQIQKSQRLQQNSNKEEFKKTEESSTQNLLPLFNTGTQQGLQKKRFSTQINTKSSIQFIETKKQDEKVEFIDIKSPQSPKTTNNNTNTQQLYTAKRPEQEENNGERKQKGQIVKGSTKQFGVSSPKNSHNNNLNKASDSKQNQIPFQTVDTFKSKMMEHQHKQNQNFVKHASFVSLQGNVSASQLGNVSSPKNVINLTRIDEERQEQRLAAVQHIVLKGQTNGQGGIPLINFERTPKNGEKQAQFGVVGSGLITAVNGEKSQFVTATPRSIKQQKQNSQGTQNLNNFAEFITNKKVPNYLQNSNTNTQSLAFYQEQAQTQRESFDQDNLQIDSSNKTIINSVANTKRYSIMNVTSPKGNETGSSSINLNRQQLREAHNVAANLQNNQLEINQRDQDGDEILQSQQDEMDQQSQENNSNAMAGDSDPKKEIKSEVKGAGKKLLAANLNGQTGGAHQRQLSHVAGKMTRNLGQGKSNKNGGGATGNNKDGNNHARIASMHSPMVQPPPEITQKRIIINLLRTEYPLIEEVAKSVMNWRVSKSENPNAEFDLFWQDLGIDSDRLTSLKLYQKVNHFPAMYQITRKTFLARNLKRLQRLFPLEYDFFPRSWILPNEILDLRSYEERLANIRKNKQKKLAQEQAKAALEARQQQAAINQQLAANLSPTNYANGQFPTDLMCNVCDKPHEISLTGGGPGHTGSTKKQGGTSGIPQAQLDSKTEDNKVGSVVQAKKSSQIVNAKTTNQNKDSDSSCEDSDDNGMDSPDPAASHTLTGIGLPQQSFRETRKAKLPNLKQKKPQMVMIVKPDCMSQGKGIFLTNDIDSIPPHETFVVQEYMRNPYLIDDLKFDMRLYVVVFSAEPLKIMLFKEGIVRFATQPYTTPDLDSPDKNFKNLTMHLTNYAVNKEDDLFNVPKSVDDPKAHKRSLKVVLEQLRAQNQDTDKLMGEIKDIIVKTLIPIQQDLAHNYRTCQPSDLENQMAFEILGFDIILNKKGKPFLLEVNHAPSFATDSPLDYAVKKQLFVDTFKFLNLSIERKRSKVLGQYEEKKNRMMTKLTLKQKNIIKRQWQDQFKKDQEIFEEENMGNFEKLFPLPVKKAAASNSAMQEDLNLTSSDKELAQKQYQALIKQEQRYNQLLSTIANTDAEKAVRQKIRTDEIREKEQKVKDKAAKARKAEKKRLDASIQNAKKKHYEERGSQLDVTKAVIDSQLGGIPHQNHQNQHNQLGSSDADQLRGSIGSKNLISHLQNVSSPSPNKKQIANHFTSQQINRDRNNQNAEPQLAPHPTKQSQMNSSSQQNSNAPARSPSKQDQHHQNTSSHQQQSTVVDRLLVQAQNTVGSALNKMGKRDQQALAIALKKNGLQQDPRTGKVSLIEGGLAERQGVSGGILQESGQFDYSDSSQMQIQNQNQSAAIVDEKQSQFSSPQKQKYQSSQNGGSAKTPSEHNERTYHSSQKKPPVQLLHQQTQNQHHNQMRKSLPPHILEQMKQVAINQHQNGELFQQQMIMNGQGAGAGVTASGGKNKSKQQKQMANYVLAGDMTNYVTQQQQPGGLVATNDKDNQQSLVTPQVTQFNFKGVGGISGQQSGQNGGQSTVPVMREQSYANKLKNMGSAGNNSSSSQKHQNSNKSAAKHSSSLKLGHLLPKINNSKNPTVQEAAQLHSSSTEKNFPNNSHQVNTSSSKQPIIQSDKKQKRFRQQVAQQNNNERGGAAPSSSGGTNMSSSDQTMKQQQQQQQNTTQTTVLSASKTTKQSHQLVNSNNQGSSIQGNGNGNGGTGGGKRRQQSIQLSHHHQNSQMSQSQIVQLNKQHQNSTVNSVSNPVSNSLQQQPKRYSQSTQSSKLGHKTKADSAASGNTTTMNNSNATHANFKQTGTPQQSQSIKMAPVNIQPIYINNKKDYISQTMSAQKQMKEQANFQALQQQIQNSMSGTQQHKFSKIQLHSIIENLYQCDFKKQPQIITGSPSKVNQQQQQHIILQTDNNLSRTMGYHSQKSKQTAKISQTTGGSSDIGIIGLPEVVTFSQQTQQNDPSACSSNLVSMPQSLAKLAIKHKQKSTSSVNNGKSGSGSNEANSFTVPHQSYPLQTQAMDLKSRQQATFSVTPLQTKKVFSRDKSNAKEKLVSLGGDTTTKNANLGATVPSNASELRVFLSSQDKKVRILAQKSSAKDLLVGSPTYKKSSHLQNPRQSVESLPLQSTNSNLNVIKQAQLNNINNSSFKQNKYKSTQNATQAQTQAQAQAQMQAQSSSISKNNTVTLEGPQAGGVMNFQNCNVTIINTTTSAAAATSNNLPAHHHHQAVQQEPQLVEQILQKHRKEMANNATSSTGGGGGGGTVVQQNNLNLSQIREAHSVGEDMSPSHQN